MQLKLIMLKMSSFSKSATILASGTAISQIMIIATLPILTRLYSPDDFEVLAIFAAMLSMLSVIATMRLEIAINIPKNERHAVYLTLFSALTSIAFGFLTGGLLYYFWSFLPSAVELEVGSSFAIFVGAGVAVAALYSVFLFWATRKKSFFLIAKGKVAQVVAGVLIQLLCGWFGYGFQGLLVGHILINGAALLLLIPFFFASKKTKSAKKLSWLKMFAVVKRYKNFPKYSVVEAFANNAALQLPVLFIASVALGPEAGFIFLAMKVLGAPITLIGKSLSQVYLSEAPQKERDGSVNDLTHEVISKILKYWVGPIIFGASISPLVFQYVFGEEWSRSGVLVLWMAPWFIMKLLSSPVSMIMHIKLLQRRMMILMLVGLLIRFLFTWFGYVIDASHIAEWFAVSGFLFYCLCFFTYARVAGLQASDLTSLFKGSSLSLSIWIALSGAACIVAYSF